MKKTYVLEFEYDESLGERIYQVFGVKDREEALAAVFKDPESLEGKLFTQILIEQLESGALPAGMLMTLAAEAFQEAVEQAQFENMKSTLEGQILSREGPNFLENLKKIIDDSLSTPHEHNCDACAAYDLCHLSIKKPKASDASNEERS
jgi:hypothetical protein